MRRTGHCCLCPFFTVCVYLCASTVCVCVISQFFFFFSCAVQFGSYTFHVAVICLSMHHQALPPAESSFWSKILILSFVQFLKTIPDAFESLTVVHMETHICNGPHHFIAAVSQSYLYLPGLPATPVKVCFMTLA